MNEAIVIDDDSSSEEGGSDGSDGSVGARYYEDTYDYTCEDNTESDEEEEAAPANSSVGQEMKDDEDDDDDSMEVLASESLSCEQIVQRKFEHAAANGYILSIDDDID